MSKEKYNAKMWKQNDRERIPGIDLCLAEGEFSNFITMKLKFLKYLGTL